MCFSGLSQERAKLLGLKLRDQGISVVKSWKHPFTHLVVPDAKTTFKFLLALCRGRHVVMENWVEDLCTRPTYPTEAGYSVRPPGAVADRDRTGLFLGVKFLRIEGTKDGEILEEILRTLGAEVRQLVPALAERGCACATFIVTGMGSEQGKMLEDQGVRELGATPITVDRIARHALLGSPLPKRPRPCTHCSTETSCVPRAKKLRHDDLVEVIFMPLVVSGDIIQDLASPPGLSPFTG